MNRFNFKLEDTNQQLLVDMIYNQLPFIESRITKEKNKNIYTDIMDSMGTVVFASDDYAHATLRINTDIDKLKKNPPKWDFWGSKLKYQNLAISHLKDIIESIDKRFINGGSSSYEVWRYSKNVSGRYIRRNFRR